MNENEPCQEPNVPMTVPTGTLSPPIQSTGNLTAQTMTLDELANRLEAAMMRPRECPHCGKILPQNLYCRVRADDFNGTITIAASLAGILSILEEKKVPFTYEAKKGHLFIKVKRRDQ